MSLGLIIGSAAAGGLLNLFSDSSQVRAQNKRVGRSQSYLRKSLIDSSEKNTMLKRNAMFFNKSAAMAGNRAAGSARNAINPGVALAVAQGPILAQSAASASQLDQSIEAGNRSIYAQIGALEMNRAEADPLGSFFAGGVRGGIAGAKASSVLSELSEKVELAEEGAEEVVTGVTEETAGVGRTMDKNIANALAIKEAYKTKTNVPNPAGNPNTYDENPNTSLTDKGEYYPPAEYPTVEEDYNLPARPREIETVNYDDDSGYTGYTGPEMMQIYMQANEIEPLAAHNTEFSKMAELSQRTPMPINPAEDPSIVDKELTATLTDLFGQDIPLEILGALTGTAAIKYLGKGVMNAGKAFRYSPDVASSIPKFTNTVKSGLGQLLKEGQHVEATVDMIRQAEKAHKAVKSPGIYEAFGAGASTARQKTASGLMKLLNEAKDQRAVEMTLDMIKQFLGK